MRGRERFLCQQACALFADIGAICVSIELAGARLTASCFITPTYTTREGRERVLSHVKAVDQRSRIFIPIGGKKSPVLALCCVFLGSRDPWHAGISPLPASTALQEWFSFGVITRSDYERVEKNLYFSLRRPAAGLRWTPISRDCHVITVGSSRTSISIIQDMPISWCVSSLACSNRSLPTVLARGRSSCLVSTTPVRSHSPSPFPLRASIVQPAA